MPGSSANVSREIAPEAENGVRAGLHESRPQTTAPSPSSRNQHGPDGSPAFSANDCQAASLSARRRRAWPGTTKKGES